MSKMSALESQLISFRQCMASCSTEATSMVKKAYAWLFGALAVIAVLILFGEEIWWGISTAFTATVSFLHLGSFFSWLGSSFHAVFLQSVSWAYSFVAESTEWATWFQHAGKVCETVGEGEAAVTTCSIETSPLNFIALAFSGAVAVFLNAIWIIFVIITFIIIFDSDYSFLSGEDWKENLSEGASWYKMVLLYIASIWVFVSLLAGVMGQMALPMFLQGNGSFSASMLIFVPVFLTCIPLLVLHKQLSESKEDVKGSLRRKLYDIEREYNVDQDVLYRIREMISNMSENPKYWINRIVLVTAASLVFLGSTYLGYYYVPEGWGFGGFLLGAVLSGGPIFIYLAKFITCYVNMRDQVGNVNKEIQALETDSKK